MDEQFAVAEVRISRGGIGPFLLKGLSSIMAVLLALMVAAIAWQVVSRYVLGTPSLLTEEFLRFSLIWLGLFGAGVCFFGTYHMNLPMMSDSMPPAGQQVLFHLNALINILFGGVLIWGGWKSVMVNAATVSPMLQISMGLIMSVIALCGLMIVLIQGRDILQRIRSDQGDLRLFLSALALLATGCAVIWLIWTSSWMQALTNDYLELTSTIVLFLVATLLLSIGTPISIGLALAGVLTLALQMNISRVLPTVGETMFNGLDSFGFLALPFFILAGNIMNVTGLARRLIDLAMLLGARFPGSLWQTNILGNILFGTLSGSGIAAASAIGGIINPVAKEKGYDMAVTTAVNAASAPVGLLIPPSGALIVYSLITGGSASIIALFMAGYVPGIIMGLAVMLYAGWYAKKHGYEADRQRHGLSETLRIVLRAVPSLLLVIIVIAGILGGAFTAIEGSGVAAVYALILGFAYRSLSLKQLGKILVDTALMTASILFLIACSAMMMWSMTFASVPETVANLIMTVADNKFLVLLIINIVLLIVGIPMDMAPAMLIFTPIFYPIVTELGVDPVHFGIIMVYNLAMGIVTPPVGTILFVACSISGQSIGAVTKPLLPIFALQIAGLLLITYVPAITLFLPRLFGL
ncbi:TRAP transporter large permease subunit [Rhizobium sp. CSW-27]|uniref:TRAP transporter large permease n=1 Tax=Rhizobium sp. CSW-27 TaxID=2839985 RepID=UPI001C0142A2|nr:TRAP transporter large permease subunit [Rhizobium sp. CSW-27]MBT9371136.1 TRAP transporter large permease subunit [Rhizobium sp. CSW-27]